MKIHLTILVCFLAMPLLAASKKTKKTTTKTVATEETTRKVTNDDDTTAPKAPAAPTVNAPAASSGGYNESPSLTLHPARNNPREWFLRLTGAGGYSVVGNSDARETDARSATGFNRNIFGNLSVMGQYGRSLGAEAEGYLGTGSARTSSSVDKVTGLLTTRSRSLSQLGFMVDAQMRLPVTQFRRDWGFHAGVGYGVASIKEVAPPSLASTVDSINSSVSGMYATIGVEVRVIPEISAGVDYATSILTSGNRTTTSSGADSKGAFDSGRFDRLRINAAYLINADYRVGLMYTRRLVSGKTAGGSTETEVANQILAMMQVIL